MLPDLEHLIQLQEIETRAADARKRVADAPARIAALDARLAASREAVEAQKQALAANQDARRSIEKDQIALQQRLSKFKEQLMEVKTNHEYHAMQSQMAATTAEIGRVEELLLVKMLEADDITAQLKGAEATLKNDESVVAAERKAIESETSEMEKVVSASAEERAQLVARVSKPTLELFERVMKARQGLAVAEASQGHCTICHVRLRPQVYNTILRNEAIVQCDHCQRILYFAGVHQRSAAGQAALDAAHTRQIDHERPNS